MTIMLAHTRNLNRVATGRLSSCYPCGERQLARRNNVTRTAGIEIGGAGIAEWQKTNAVIKQTTKELDNWIAAYSEEAKKRMEETAKKPVGERGGMYACVPETKNLENCLLPNELEAYRWIKRDWNLFVVDWNKLTRDATTGVPWGDDEKLREYQKKIIDLRNRFEELAVYKFLPIPAWSEDRSFFEAVKESTGTDFQKGIQNLGLIVAGVGGLLVLTTILKK